MKVEFIESEFWGVALLVAEADFKLAKTKDAEFDSLAHATAAFANLFDVDYTIARSEYNAALDARYYRKRDLVYYLHRLVVLHRTKRIPNRVYLCA